MKTTVYIATSLDGFIAKKDGSVDWLHKPEYAVEGEDYGYGALMSSVDALIMGRTTYETVMSLGVDWPYGNTQVVVLSSRNLEIPAEISATVSQMGGAPADILAALKAAGMQHLYIDGGKTVRDFLTAGLINELIITRIPILLGEGIPLFGPIAEDMPLIHVRTEAYASGLVQSQYSLHK